MANIDENFVVKTGLTVGPTTITASTGDIVLTSGNVTVGATRIDAATGNITIGGTTINGTTGAITSTGNIVTTSNFIVGSTILSPTGQVTTSNIITTGGTINNTTIGGATPAPAYFTTLSATGTLTTTDILPSANGVSNIGSPTARFNTIFVDTAKLSTNTLYLGDTAILGTSNNTVNIHADPGQAISIQTSGAAGTLTLVSNAQATIQTTGNSADVLIQSNGTGSQTRILSGTNVTMTAPAVAANGNLTVTGSTLLNGATTIQGNLTVTGTTTAVNTTDLNVQDNIIIVNSGESGVGVTAGSAGIQFARGQVSSYQLIFRESDDSLQFGPIGSTIEIADKPWATTTFVAKNGTETLGNLTVTGTASATNLASANAVVTGGSINNTPIGATTRAAGNFTTVNANSGITGTLQTAAQTNITSVGTLDSLVTTGNVTVGNNLIVSGNLTIQGTQTTLNTATLSVTDLHIELAAGAVSAAAADTGGIHLNGAGANIVYASSDDSWNSNKLFKSSVGFSGPVNGNLTGTLQTAAQPNVTSVGTLSSLTVTAGVSAASFTGSGANLTTGTVPNSALTNSQVTVTAGTGMSGGGNVSLGGTVTLTNAGVTQLTGGGGVSVSGSTGAITLNTTATSANTASAIVARDVSGNFTAGTISAALSGTATYATNIAGGASWQIPYQTGSAATSFVSAGTTGQILTATTGGAPAWATRTTVDSLATSGVGISVNASTGAVTITSNATSANTASTVVARDASGNFTAGVITATATNARYADLAELYAADAEYLPGTVLSFGGDAEVTESLVDGDRKVAGVVSTAPAYLMNRDLGGVKAALALQGRVPCKVTGKIAKGDMLVAAGNGCARAEAEPKLGQVIGKALEDFNGTEGVIEVVVGRM